MLTRTIASIAASTRGLLDIRHAASVYIIDDYHWDEIDKNLLTQQMLLALL